MSAANEPPLDARRQADGSYVQELEDGSTKRWTRRPDGTWRKPEHRRAGFVGELEQKKYVPPGAAVQARLQGDPDYRRSPIPGLAPVAGMAAGGLAPRVPGLPPGASPDMGATPSQAQARTAQAAKNERRKEKRHEKQEAKELERRAELEAAVMAPGGPRGQPTLRDGEELVADVATLQWLAGGNAADAPARAAKNDGGAARLFSSALSGTASPGAGADAAKDAEKTRKALEKKLRQVIELQERHQRGEALNPEQLAKLATRESLEEQLAALPASVVEPYHSSGNGVRSPFPSG